MPKERFELTREYSHYALNVARLPFRHLGKKLKSDFRYMRMRCGRRDLNPHALRRSPLKTVCLPIPPLPQLGAIEQQSVRSLQNQIWFRFSLFRVKMVGATGLEPVTSFLSGMCSNQLSYAPGKFENLTALAEPILKQTKAIKF